MPGNDLPLMQPGRAPAGSAAEHGWLDRADLMFCLARAFLPPPAAWTAAQWAEPLAQDLHELAAALALDAKPALHELRALQTAGSGDAAASAPPWLVEYSRLFLVPPVPVPLNTGLYLEGAIGARSAQMMQSCYETAGMAPDASFRDLPDHVAMQLEFLGRLYERAARGEPDAAAMAEEFAAEFVFGWAGPLEQACARACEQAAAAGVYQALARLVRVALGEPDLAGG
jgi:TorA maturation chaperone TorD